MKEITRNVIYLSRGDANEIKRGIYIYTFHELNVLGWRERENESGVYAIDNIHGQKYSSATYRLSAYVVPRTTGRSNLPEKIFIRVYTYSSVENIYAQSTMRNTVFSPIFASTVYR